MFRIRSRVVVLFQWQHYDHGDDTIHVRGFNQLASYPYRSPINRKNITRIQISNFNTQVLRYTLDLYQDDFEQKICSSLSCHRRCGGSFHAISGRIQTSSRDLASESSRVCSKIQEGHYGGTEGAVKVIVQASAALSDYEWDSTWVVLFAVQGTSRENEE